MSKWEPQALIFVKIYQKCSKFPLASDFTAVSGSVDSTTSLANDFFVPHMVLNTSSSIHRRSNQQMGEPQVLTFVKIYQKC